MNMFVLLFVSMSLYVSTPESNLLRNSIHLNVQPLIPGNYGVEGVSFGVFSKLEDCLVKKGVYDERRVNKRESLEKKGTKMEGIYKLYSGEWQCFPIDVARSIEWKPIERKRTE